MTDKAWLALLTGTLGSDASTDAVLAGAKADYDVVANQVYVFDRFIDSFVAVPNRYVTGREVDGRLENWEVVKERYAIEPNVKILRRATNLVNKYGGLATLRGCGVLDEGRKFFAVLHTGSLSIKTLSKETDIIDNYIVVMSSHDGSIPICYYNLDSRRSTNTTYRFNESKTCDFSMRKRHTPSEANLDGEAKEVMSMRKAWSQHVVENVSSLCAPVSALYVSAVLDKVWPLSSVSTEKKREHLEAVHETVKQLYGEARNSGMYGHSKWALLNSISEYIDFHRNIPDMEAAQHSLEMDNFSHRLKLEVHKCLSS